MKEISFTEKQLQLLSTGRTVARETPRFHCTTKISSTTKNHQSANQYSRSDLEQCSKGLLFGQGYARLPSSPLLMLDRITDIQADGGHFGRGYAIAELDITPETWFFKHHFEGDPVMPGCYLIEALWQLTGFHIAWSGHKGSGRVLDSGRARFIESIGAKRQTLSIAVQIRKFISTDYPVCIANGEVLSNGLPVCKSDSIIVGLIE